jgi:DNA-binding IclR family transcriptional regulator
VLTDDGRPIAAINVSIPHPLKGPEEIEEVLAPKVIATAREIGALASKVAPNLV